MTLNELKTGQRTWKAAAVASPPSSWRRSMSCEARPPLYALILPAFLPQAWQSERSGMYLKPLIGICIMLFRLIGSPCMTTVAVTRREEGSRV